jgi:hypothetical protein
MDPHLTLPGRRFWLGALAAVALGLLAPHPARAQTTMTAEAGLKQYFKPLQWFPIQVTLTNQGAPTKVEVRAQIQSGADALQEYRIAPRELQSNANELHTLYIRAPMSYGSLGVKMDLYQDGRKINTITPSLTAVNAGDWLAVGIGNADWLNQLLSVSLNPQYRSSTNRAMVGMFGGGMGQAPKISVATRSAAQTPDRWQGLAAADMVLLDDVSERELSPDQQRAIRDYVVAGGTLVVTGGVNARNLATPYWSDLLPVRVTGLRNVTSVPLPANLGHRSSPTGNTFVIAAATAKPDADVRSGTADAPVIAVGRKGAGKVVFVAFDPGSPPFKTWDGNADVFARLMATERTQPLLPLLTANESDDPNYMQYQGGSQIRLADAPYAISQLDIPAFYIVASFLLAYIIVLVPVNYYFLKAKDKKEYAWLTTPLIVLLFSLGAYLIGYGFKGGRTLVVKVGVAEATAGQDAAPSLVYAGLFSPRKTGYDLQLASNGPHAADDAASTLLSEPAASRSTSGLQVVEGDAGQKIDDFAVDMWAMRVLKGEGIIRLGSGITAALHREGSSMVGELKNGSGYTLSDCHILVRGQAIAVNDLPPGGTQTIKMPPPGPSAGGLFPSSLLNDVKGGRDEQRMKRAVLQPLLGQGAYAQAGPQDAVLIGWIQEPVARLEVDGQAPREQAATLLMVHLK